MWFFFSHGSQFFVLALQKHIGCAKQVPIKFFAMQLPFTLAILQMHWRCGDIRRGSKFTFSVLKDKAAWQHFLEQSWRISKTVVEFDACLSQSQVHSSCCRIRELSLSPFYPPFCAGYFPKQERIQTSLTVFQVSDYSSASSYELFKGRAADCCYIDKLVELLSTMKSALAAAQWKTKDLQG